VEPPLLPVGCGQLNGLWTTRQEAFFSEDEEDDVVEDFSEEDEDDFAEEDDFSVDVEEDVEVAGVAVVDADLLSERLSVR
jgi:hypothetical protein